MNEELVVEVFRQIERQPKSWDQGYYTRYDTECGTAHCFAGWAVVLADARDQLTSEGPFDMAWAIVADRVLGHGFYRTGMYSGSNSLGRLYLIAAREMGIEVEVLRDKVRSEL